MPSVRPASSEAFAAVYREHVQFVWRTLARRGVQPAMLEDATQEVFIVAHRRWGAWEKTSLRGWLYGVARKVAATYQRGERRRRRKHDAMPAPSPAPALDSLLVDRERLRIVEQAVAALDPKLREVLILVEVDALRAAEIASMLGCNVNTVYTRLRRARLAVAAAIQEHETEPRRRSAGAA